MWSLSLSLKICYCTNLKPFPSLRTTYYALWAFEEVTVVKNLPASAGAVRDLGSVPALGRTPGRGPGNPLQYSCLENPVDRGAWRVTVHRITESNITKAT